MPGSNPSRAADFSDSISKDRDYVVNTLTTNEMYGFHFDRYVGDESNFQPQDGHRTIEIVESADHSEIRLSIKTIPEREISSWIQQVSSEQQDYP